MGLLLMIIGIVGLCQWLLYAYNIEPKGTWKNVKTISYLWLVFWWLVVLFGAIEVWPEG